jgi:hypothetical protein
MPKQIELTIYPDGKIQAEIKGVKGKKCTDYIKVLEEMLDAATTESAFTPEAFEPEIIQTEAVQQQKIGEGSCG